MNQPLDDQLLMRRVAIDRDQQALMLLYNAYSTAVYSIAYRVLQEATAAEEVTQDTFLKAWNQAERWDPARGKLKSWLLAIAHYSAIDRLRRERRQPALADDPIEESESLMGSAETVTGGTALHDRALMGQMLNLLPEEQARLIRMAFFHGLSHSEIAEVTRIPLGTIKTRLRVGMQRLRVLWLEGDGEPPHE